MRLPLSVVTLALALLATAAGAHATGQLDSAALRAYAGAPWDKAALAHTTVELGRYRNVPVVADFPCADVCPQYTVRIIHFRLPPDVSCASVGGVEQEVAVPVAIAVVTRTYCVPQPLVEGRAYFAR